MECSLGFVNLHSGSVGSGVMCVPDLSSWEAEVGLLEFQGQFGLNSEFQATQGYLARA